MHYCLDSGVHFSVVRKYLRFQVLETLEWAVLEAMALACSVVVDYAGPAELVTPDIGFKVPIGRREDIVSAFNEILTMLVANQDALQAMSSLAISRVQARFTWEAKAKQVAEIYNWVLDDKTKKPDFF